MKKLLTLTFISLILLYSCSSEQAEPELPVTKQYTLTVSVTGQGSVSPDANGTYNYGAVITITATPDEGYQFNRWEGTDNDDMPYGCWARPGNCRTAITMDSNRSVIAFFSKLEWRFKNFIIKKLLLILCFVPIIYSCSSDEEGYLDPGSANQYYSNFYGSQRPGSGIYRPSISFCPSTSGTIPKLSLTHTGGTTTLELNTLFIPGSGAAIAGYRVINNETSFVTATISGTNLVLSALGTCDVRSILVEAFQNSSSCVAVQYVQITITGCQTTG